MRFLYLLAVYLAAPLISAVFLWRGLRDRGYWRNFGERFGFGAPAAPHGVWIHAVSVGEVQACAPLVGVLRQRYPDLPLTVTALTPTGAARARALFGNAAQVRYVPFDLPGAVRRFFARVQPRLAVIVETELWPNLYRECGRRRVPLVLASARLSARSVGRYRRLGALFRDTLSQAAVVAAQGTVDAERFRALGADPASTHVTGNLKFDFELPAQTVERGARLREQYARGRPLWVAGSTHGGGEEQALRQALESSQTALKATEAGYEVGTRTAVDVLNSRKILVQAKTDYSGSRYDYIVSVLQLRLAAGNLDRPQLTEINNYLTVAAPTSPPVTPENLAPTIPPAAPPPGTKP